MGYEYWSKHIVENGVNTEWFAAPQYYGRTKRKEDWNWIGRLLSVASTPNPVEKRTSLLAPAVVMSGYPSKYQLLMQARSKKRPRSFA